MAKRAARKMDGRRKRREWMKQHVQELRAHSRNKTPVAVISRQTKRTPGALRQKALELGLPLGHRR
jgi:hypothetical protein